MLTQFLEGYQTAIDDEEQREYDVFIILKSTLMSLQGGNPQLYNALTSTLTAEFQTVTSRYCSKNNFLFQELQKIMQEADNKDKAYAQAQ